jgi:hypothetical protein
MIYIDIFLRTAFETAVNIVTFKNPLFSCVFFAAVIIGSIGGGMIAGSRRRS